MASNGENAYEELSKALGQPEGTGEWFVVDQARIDAFAEVTEDRQFIHIDPAAFAEVTEDRQFIHVDPALAATMSPWGGTIAHGFLTLSLLTVLCSSLPQKPGTLTGILMGVNYGFDKVRFVNPVKVGSKVRASSVLSAVEQKDPNTLQTTRTVTVEIEGEVKPALVAEWVTRLVYG